jgi:hypothetical protein
MLGPVPFGYRRLPDGSIVVVRDDATFVREAYERYGSGRYSLRDMAEWARVRRAGDGDKSAFDRMSIRKLLRNISYTGVVAFHRRQGNVLLTPGKHPAIVDDELFAVVQRTLLRRRRAPETNRRPWGKQRYPLSGITRCGSCGASMGGSASGLNAVRYLRCSTAVREGRLACRQRMVRAETLEVQLASFLSSTGLNRCDVEVALLVPLTDGDAGANLDLGDIFLRATPEVQRRMVHEFFEELRVDGQRLMPVRMRDRYEYLLAR